MYTKWQVQAVCNPHYCVAQFELPSSVSDRGHIGHDILPCRNVVPHLEPRTYAVRADLQTED